MSPNVMSSMIAFQLNKKKKQMDDDVINKLEDDPQWTERKIVNK